MADNLENVGVISVLAKEILGLLLKDKSSMERYGFVIEPEVFENPIHRLLFRISREHFEKYGQLPRQKIIEQELAERLKHSEGRYVPDEFFWKEATDIFLLDIQREYISDKFDEWVVRRALMKISEKAKFASSASTPELEGIRQELRKADEFMCGTKELGKFIFRDAATRNREADVAEKIPTGIKELDAVLEGGRDRGTLGVIMAPAGYGKSSVLIIFGVNAARARFRVLHVTLELSQRAVIRRYEAAFTKTSKVKITDQEEGVKRKLKRISKLVTPADILVKEFPAKSLGMDGLRSYLSNVIFWESFMPDMLLIDYADIMRLPGRASEDRWSKEGELYVELRGLAQEFKIAVWTAAQAKKQTLSKKKLRIDDLAGAVEKAQVADCIIALCIAPDEKEKHEGRLFIAKNRDGIDDATIYFKENFEQCRIESMGKMVRGEPDVVSEVEEETKSK